MDRTKLPLAVRKPKDKIKFSNSPISENSQKIFGANCFYIF